MDMMDKAWAIGSTAPGAPRAALPAEPLAGPRDDDATGVRGVLGVEEVHVAADTALSPLIPLPIGAGAGAGAWAGLWEVGVEEV
jgi:hypothetical protein